MSSWKKKEALIAGDFDKLSHLSQSKNSASEEIAEPVKVAEPVKIAEPVKVAEPVKIAEPVKVAEPVEAKKQISSEGDDE